MENESLVADLLEWVALRPRPYDEVMDAWRTTCPRLSVWEDTLDANLIRLEHAERSSKTLVGITEQGTRFLRSVGRTS